MDDETKVEAILYATRNPLSVRSISLILGIEAGAISRIIKKLRLEYKKRNTSLEIAKIGNKYRIQLKKEYYDFAYRVMEPELSKYETGFLATVALNEGASLSFFRKRYGSRTDDMISKLKTMSLIRTSKKGNGTAIYLGENFEKVFGITKKELLERATEYDRQN
ncbi:SMC-Scp complex subunit ScpB [Thermoplasma volcanium]|nr:SMC-Scp complex subunit ScpB [Thermoplasma volcanium]